MPLQSARPAARTLGTGENMSTQTKQHAHALKPHHLILYRRALHPELVQMRQRRTINHGSYELEAWTLAGGHMLRFQHGKFVASELVTDLDGGLPTTGAVATFPCAGEKDYEHPFDDAGVNYITTVQTENLSANLYRATYDEMMAFAQETDAMTHTWENADGGRCLSLLDLQRYGKEIHTQAYHLNAQGGFVLRTQTIFEHR